MPFYAAGMAALCLFWLALVNLAKVVCDRIQTQVAADNAALTTANMRARALNFTGALNGFLGMPGFILTLPGLGLTAGEKSLVWWVEPPHRALGFHTYSNSANAAKGAVKAIVTLQKAILTTYGGGTAFLAAQEASRLNGADGIVPLDSFSLRLKRNKGEIWYFKTSELYIPPTPITPEIFVWPIPYPIDTERGADRWLERKDDFYNQRMRLIAFKEGGKARSDGYPVGGRIFGISGWPDVRCIAAAAAYNAKGAMFPAGGSTAAFAALNEYLKARGGGWESHLVPVGRPFMH
jgi:hypothetical protein